MFRAAPMVQLHAVVLKGDERAVLEHLGSTGVMELSSAPYGQDNASPDPRDHATELMRCERIRTCVEELGRSLGIGPLSGEVPSAEMTLSQAEENLRSMESDAHGLLAQRRQLSQRRKDIIDLSERVSCYRGLHIPLDEFDGSRFFHFVAGSLPSGGLERLEKEWGGSAIFLPFAERKGRQSVVAITTSLGREAMEEAFLQADFQREVFPQVSGITPDALCDQRERERQEVDAELAKCNERLKELGTVMAGPMAEIGALADVERRLMEASVRLPRTEASVLLSGWVPADSVATVKEGVKEVTRGRYVIETEAPDGTAPEQVPVLLRHSRLLRPFEVLVSTYGLPNYGEFEPTLFVALSYILMFGVMFGDAGHGAVLAACGLALLISGRSGQARDFGILLLFGGSSSMLFGIIYGSYFGIEVFKHYALWHDPLEGDPMLLMYGAIGFGIVMMSLGLILNMINRFRRGDVLGGFLDKFGLVGLLFYWGAIALLVKGEVIESWGLMPLAVIVFLILPLLGWVLKEPVEHLRGHAAEGGGGMGSAIMESFMGAFEAVLSYLANTISFVRLAAYSMSHAALLVAAFMLAHEVKDLPVAGGTLSVIIIILGNLVAIVLEGIIASVQALRLEYYEFFGKFFAGNGHPFEPFRLPGGRRTPAP